MSVKKTVGNVLNKKGLNVWGTVGVGLNVMSTVQDYKQSRMEGQGKVGAAISAVGNAVMFEAIGLPGMLALGAIKEAPKVAVNTALKASQMARGMDSSRNNKVFNNANYLDSKQAYTMRQAGMQLAEASKYNLQQAMLGNEASTMHRL